MDYHVAIEDRQQLAGLLDHPCGPIVLEVLELLAKDERPIELDFTEATRTLVRELEHDDEIRRTRALEVARCVARRADLADRLQQEVAAQELRRTPPIRGLLVRCQNVLRKASG